MSSLVFAPNYKELVSGHGFAHDKVIIWKYPSLSKVAELEGKFEIVILHEVICVITLQLNITTTINQVINSSFSNHLS